MVLCVTKKSHGDTLSRHGVPLSLSILLFFPSVNLCAFSVILCVTKKITRRYTEQTRSTTELLYSINLFISVFLLLFHPLLFCYALPCTPLFSPPVPSRRLSFKLDRKEVILNTLYLNICLFSKLQGHFDGMDVGTDTYRIKQTTGRK